MPIFTCVSLLYHLKALEGELSTVFTKSNLPSNVANPLEKFKETHWKRVVIEYPPEGLSDQEHALTITPYHGGLEDETSGRRAYITAFVFLSNGISN